MSPKSTSRFALCCCSIALVVASARPSAVLELVQVVFRHGERTPLELEHDAFDYTDASLYEPYGLGHLTNNGKRQAYNLGAMLREKYARFLGVDANDDVYAYSSDNPRTRASMQLALAGLLEPAGAANATKWHPRLEWTPAPYRSAPEKWDIVLNPDKKRKYKELWIEAKSSAEYGAKLAEQMHFCEYVRGRPHVDKGNASDVAHVVASVFNVLRSNEGMQLPLPDWYTSRVKRSLARLFDLELEAQSFTPEMRKLNGGVLIKQLLRNVQLNAIGGGRGGEATTRKRRRKKLYLYSGHDLNVAAVQRSMGVVEPVIPEFASALLFEQYRRDDGELYLKAFYWDTVADEATSLKLDGCDELCLVRDYYKLLSHVIPTDDECRQLLGDDLDSGVVKRLYEDLFSD